MPSLAQVIVWIVVGLLGGSLAGLIIKWDREGLARSEIWLWASPALSWAACCFACWDFFRNSTRWRSSLRDVVAAVAGSLLVLLGLWFWQRFKRLQ